MRHVRGLVATLLIAVVSLAGAPPSAAAPEGQMTWAVHVSLAPTWFDPAETSGIITPFLILYALHDATVKPMPGTLMAPALAESWSMGQGSFWLYFPEQWDPKSPWHDRRVRLAVNHAIDRQAINQAETLGFSKITWSIIPSHFEFYWQPPGYPYDPARAKQLLSEAGYANGFDAGDYSCDAAFGLIPAYAFSAPYEDLKLRGK